MTQKLSFPTQPIQPNSFVKPILIGAGIGLVLITVFLLGVKNPKPEWGSLWILKPLIIVPLAGAMGGACQYVANHLFYLSGWKKGIIFLLSLIGYVIALWLGTVLGLNGTLWN